MNNTNQQNDVINEIRNSRGRFFGLYTKNRPAINAQFQGETPSYVMIFDRNSRAKRKLAKSSIIGVYISGRAIGETY
jgi:hypothetical protein